MTDIEEDVLLIEDDKEDIENNEYTDLSEQNIVTQSSNPTIQSLYSQFQDGEIILQDKFQRKYVWDKKKASALIESILLGFPLPIVYMSEEKDGKWIVIDGQQRLTSIFNFMNGQFKNYDGSIEDFKLINLKVLTKYNKCKYIELEKEDQRRLKNYPINVVLITNKSGKDIKFDMFERLNSGSVALNDMELRNCIYRGTYMETLKELASNHDFRELVGLRTEEPRMKDVELVLRFLAFSHKTYLKYSPPMKKFLNEDCEAQKYYDEKQKNIDIETFKMALNNITTVFGKHAFKRFFLTDKNSKTTKWEDKKFNVSLFDIYMWVFSRFDRNKITRNSDLIREKTMDIMINDEVFIDSITRATSGNKQVETRFKIYNDLVKSIVDKDETQKRCFSYELKEELFNKKPVCEICHQRIMSIDDAAVDHIEQFGLGGKTIPENARLTHRYCNDARSRTETLIALDQEDK